MTAEAGRITRTAIRTITTPSELDAVVSEYLSRSEFVIDVETVGDHRLDPRRNHVMWVGLATEGRADVIPIGHPNGELVEVKRSVLPSGVSRLREGKALRKGDISKAQKNARKVYSDPPDQMYPADVFSRLEPLLFGDLTKIGANIKFDLETVSKYYRGKIPTPPYADVIMADFLIDDTNHHRMSLSHIVRRRLGYSMPKGVGKEVESHPFQTVARYVHGDVKFTWLLWKELKKSISSLGLSGVFDLEMDCLGALMRMEQEGTLIDVDSMSALHKELHDGIRDLTADAYRIVGQPFNVNSSADKRKFLFTEEGRNLTPKGFTDVTKEPGTNVDALKHHSRDPLVKVLLKIADLKKLESTYVIPYLGGEVVRTTGGKSRTEFRESLLVNGRVHTNFKSHGARTGRMSSNNPNLQNIPSRGSFGPRIRSMFVADPGHVLLVGDYSQIEPRLMASFSKDRLLIDTFLEGGDPYLTVAEQLGVDRRTGKVLILGMAYGIGSYSIGEDLGISTRAAKDLIEGFRKGFPSLDRYRKEVVASATRKRPVPYVKTILGRRRLIPLLNSKDQEERAKGARQAFNSRIQGSAADVIKLALVRINVKLPAGSKLLLTVHDEIVASCPEELVEESREAMRSAMEDIELPLSVPLSVDIGTGSNWAEAK